MCRVDDRRATVLSQPRDETVDSAETTDTHLPDW
jgi:hypothetical protein